MANDTYSAHQQIDFTTHQESNCSVITLVDFTTHQESNCSVVTLVVEGDDEGYQESISSLVTLPLEISEGKLENGRLFATYGDHGYFLPIDEEELDRLNRNHFKYFLLYSCKHFLSPITNPQNILDLGCGSGM
jgi:hypothetical protein